MNVLITGSTGLIGSEAVRFYSGRPDVDAVVGIDNNMRKRFFGDKGTTHHTKLRLIAECSKYVHGDIDVADANMVAGTMARYKPDIVIHAAAQPSHDWAAEDPFTDFHVNANGTMSVLEAVRQFAPDAAVIHVSTNKVYGDNPNNIPVVETDTRYLYDSVDYLSGVDETMSVDQCMHSLFGVSKLAGDLMAQEYARYFGLKVGIFRPGCLTGPAHAGVEQHGFLSYLVHCIKHKKPYKVYGHRGKQVRDQLHAHDVVRAFDAFARAPRPGEVYNLGGGRAIAASVLESIEMIQLAVGHKTEIDYGGAARKGDHRCYYSNTDKLRRHYGWQPERDMNDILNEMIEAA